MFTTAFYHNSPKTGENKGFSWPSSTKQKSDMKKSNDYQRKYLRLNSLEGSCQTFKKSPEDKGTPIGSPKMAQKSVDAKLPPSSRESKWFGRYNQDHQYPHFQHQYQQHPYYQNTHLQPYHHHYQMPYNLSKGQYEIWPMMQEGQMIQPMMSQCCVSQSEVRIGVAAVATTADAIPEVIAGGAAVECVHRCVNSFMEWGSQLMSGFISSTLNPNAKEFTPSLNPNAKEFQPSSAEKPDKKVEVPEDIEHVQEAPKKPEVVTAEKVQYRAVNQRKCTPWIPKGTPINLSSDQDLSDLELPDDITTDSDEDEEEDDDDLDDTKSRSRLLSICSSEDGFIQFDEQISSSPKVLTKIDKSKASPFLLNFLAAPDDDDESESEDDDSDWDKSYDHDQVIFDTEDLVPNWTLIPLQNNKISDEVDKAAKANIIKCCDDAYPDQDRDHQEVLRRIKEANDKWDKLDFITEESHLLVKVNFNDPLVIGIRYEEPELAEELRQARLNDCAQRKADQERYNRLLAPIFEGEHRDKIRSYIERCNLSDN